MFQMNSTQFYDFLLHQIIEYCLQNFNFFLNENEFELKKRD
jgi:hypothetical protein